MNKEREVEIRIGDKWLLIDGLKSVKRNQVFRMWEDEEPYYDDLGRSNFRAISEPYWSDTFNTWMVDIAPTYMH
jgi:hypothetical protein